MKKIFIVEHDGIYGFEHFPIPTGDIATFHGVTGITDITNTGFSEMLDKVRNAAKETGQNEAWELITKTINMSSQDRDDIFGSIWLDNIAKLGFKEANVKYKTWCEEKKNQTISVGEVYSDEFGRKVLVTFATEVLIDFMFMDGSCGHLVTDKFRKRYPLKTDRHIDISSIIDRLQED